jgi:hypothetical protein
MRPNAPFQPPGSAVFEGDGVADAAAADGEEPGLIELKSGAMRIS